jgi:hypothetical protein
MASIAMMLLSVAVLGQAPDQVAKDLSMHFLRAPGVEVRFVDYHWQPALFEAMEKGDAGIPLATRNWVVARITLDERPLRIEGKLMAVGAYALAWWPNLDGKGMGFEIRRVDMREVIPQLNALAPLPRGETIYRGKAEFENTDAVAPRLDAVLDEKGGTVTLAIRYGDRRLLVPLTR